METSGEPIPFIEIVDVMEESGSVTRFEVNSQSISFLASLKERQVAIVCIAGPQRTGKSFLANRLLKRMKGFAIGPTTNPCTKGIWLWNQPIRLNEKTDMLIMDTEGLHSTQRDETIDMKIFSLSILLSSMFIYNQLGHIDEQSLENLSLVVNLSQNISISKNTEGDGRISDYCPYFFWVLRDFSLDLKGKDSRAYLEDVLRPVSGEGQDVDRKNMIREKLREYFKERECLCMIRPVAEETKLARIEDQKWEDLRPGFIEAVYNFEKSVFTHLQPKTIQMKPLSGEMFLKLTCEYVEAINNGGIPQILTSIERVISTEIRKIVETTQSFYYKKVNEQLNENQMPFDVEELYSIHRKIMSEIEAILEKSTKTLLDAGQILDLKREFREKMEKEFENKEKINEEKSKIIATNLVYSFFNAFKLPTIDSVETYKATLIKEKQIEFNNFMGVYLQKAKGPYKDKLLLEKLPSFLFNYFENFLEMIQKKFTEEHNKTKVYLAQAREGEERLRKNIKDFESLVFELQKDKETLKRENELSKREFEKNLKFKELELEEFKSQAEDLMKSKDSKKRKMTNLNSELGDLQDTIRKLNQELNEKKIENASLLKKISEFEKLVKIQTTNMNLEFSPEVVNLVKDLKAQVNQIEEFHKKKAQENNFTQKYMNELEELRAEKFNQINKLREKQKNKLEEMKKNYEKELTQQKKRLEVLNKYNDDLKEQLIELQKKNETTEKKDFQIKTLINENQKLNEALNYKNSNLETHLEMFEKNKFEIEKLSSIQLELEQKLAIVFSEKSNLFSFKETFPYVLKETLKWVTGKKSNLKHSLRNLNEEDFQLIKSCFDESGLPLNF